MYSSRADHQQGYEQSRRCCKLLRPYGRSHGGHLPPWDLPYGGDRTPGGQHRPRQSLQVSPPSVLRSSAHIMRCSLSSIGCSKLFTSPYNMSDTLSPTTCVSCFPAYATANLQLLLLSEVRVEQVKAWYKRYVSAAAGLLWYRSLWISLMWP